MPSYLAVYGVSMVLVDGGECFFSNLNVFLLYLWDILNICLEIVMLIINKS